MGWPEQQKQLWGLKVRRPGVGRLARVSCFHLWFAHGHLYVHTASSLSACPHIQMPPSHIDTNPSGSGPTLMLLL